MKTSEIFDIMELVSPALKHGIKLTISFDGVDLNTDGKSSCVLSVVDGDIVAHRRYDRVDTVKDFDHLVTLVYECVHRRDFFNKGWLKVFEECGMDNPLGNF